MWSFLFIFFIFFSFKISFSQFGFPFKMMPYKLNHNLICLDFRPLFKSFETNLKLLTNRNA
jgi:hypothetical protein